MHQGYSLILSEMIFEICFVIKVQHLRIYCLLETFCTTCLFFIMVLRFLLNYLFLMNFRSSFHFLEQTEPRFFFQKMRNRGFVYVRVFVA
jgi:hypothetical protein